MERVLSGATSDPLAEMKPLTLTFPLTSTRTSTGLRLRLWTPPRRAVGIFVENARPPSASNSFLAVGEIRRDNGIMPTGRHGGVQVGRCAGDAPTQRELRHEKHLPPARAHGLGATFFFGVLEAPRLQNLTRRILAIPPILSYQVTVRRSSAVFFRIARVRKNPGGAKIQRARHLVRSHGQRPSRNLLVENEESSSVHHQQQIRASRRWPAIPLGGYVLGGALELNLCFKAAARQ